MSTQLHPYSSQFIPGRPISPSTTPHLFFSSSSAFPNRGPDTPAPRPLSILPRAVYLPVDQHQTHHIQSPPSSHIIRSAQPLSKSRKRSQRRHKRRPDMQIRMPDLTNSGLFTVLESWEEDEFQHRISTPQSSRSSPGLFIIYNLPGARASSEVLGIPSHHPHSPFHMEFARSDDDGCVNDQASIRRLSWSTSGSESCPPTSTGSEAECGPMDVITPIGEEEDPFAYPNELPLTPEDAETPRSAHKQFPPCTSSSKLLSPLPILSPGAFEAGRKILSPTTPKSAHHSDVISRHSKDQPRSVIHRRTYSREDPVDLEYALK